MELKSRPQILFTFLGLGSEVVYETALTVPIVPAACEGRVGTVVSRVSTAGQLRLKPVWLRLVYTDYHFTRELWVFLNFQLGFPGRCYYIWVFNDVK